LNISEQNFREQKTRQICSDGFMIFLTTYHIHLAWEQVWKWWWCNWIKIISYEYEGKGSNIL